MMLILITLLVVLGGVILGRYLYPAANTLISISVGILLGIGLYIISMYLLGVMGIAWTQLTLIILAITFFGSSLTLMNSITIPSRAPNQLLGILVVLLFAFFSVVVNSYWPVRDWDALTLYDFRAKVFSENQEITGIFTPELNYYLAYPFFTSLIHTVSYIFDYGRPAIYYSLVYTALGLFIYGFLSQKVSKVLSIIFTILVLISGDIFNHSFISYTNLTYTTYFVVGILIFSEGIATKKSKLLFLGSTLIGIMQHVRYDDPFWVIPMLISLLIFVKTKNYKPLLISTLIIFLFRILWSGYKNTLMSEYATVGSMPYPQLLETLLSTNPVQRVIEVSTFLYKSLWLKYGILIYIFVFSVLISWRKKSELLRLSQITTILILAILYLGTIAMSYLYAKWNVVGGSVARMMMIIIPTSLVSACLALGEYFNEKK